MRKVPGFVAGLLTAALAGCVVTPVEYRYAPPPPAAPPAPEPVAYESDVTASEPPPPLPVYEQPPCPVEGYVWTPGLWRWGPSGFYWVPGTWVAPPAVGLLWTPGYWVLAGPVFVFHAGYWGPHVGYYGGINYGGGYTGEGYHGGRWVNNTFQYNTAVSNVNVTNIHNTYNQTIINNVTINNTTIVRTSYAGGPGTRTERTAREVEVAKERHLPATTLQVRHDDSARADPQLAAAHNAGHPPIAATPRPGAFTAPGVTAARPVGPAWHPKAAPEVAERPARSDGAMARTPETAAHPAPPFAHAPEPGVAPRKVQPVTPPVTARVQEAQPRPRPQAQQPPQQPRAQPKPQAQPQSAPRPQSRPDRREGEKKPPEQKGEHGTERAQ